MLWIDYFADTLAENNEEFSAEYTEDGSFGVVSGNVCDDEITDYISLEFLYSGPTIALVLASILNIHFIG